MKGKDFLELIVAIVAGIICILLIVSVSFKQTAKTSCDLLCKTEDSCFKEKFISGDVNNYTEIECRDGSKFIITEVKK